MRSTLAASVATFGGALFVTAGIPALVGLSLAILGPVFATVSLSWVGEAILYYAGLLLVATNLPATVIFSEILLLEEGAIFFFQQSVGSHLLWFFSPWPVFILIYLLLALLLYWATVRRVKRIADK